MTEQDLTDKEREQHEQAWQDLDEKVILVQILTELQQIRMTLTDATDDAQRQSNTGPTYRCRKCQATVEPSDRERHRPIPLQGSDYCLSSHPFRCYSSSVT